MRSKETSDEYNDFSEMRLPQSCTQPGDLVH
jgi:hypothetical protein